jgi:hypothetical protein
MNSDPKLELLNRLGQLSRFSRRQALSALTALIPAIEATAGPSALKQMSATIADVGRWWP